MLDIQGQFISFEGGNSKIFVRGDILPIDTTVKVMSKAGNSYKAIITSTHSKIRDGYSYNYILYDSEPSVLDLDELLGLL